MFNTKAREMDQRTLENQLVFFPTDEPWTQWTTDYSWNQFADFRTRGRIMASNTQAPQSSRPLIDRVGPPPTSPRQPRQSRRARGHLTTGDPSLPMADSRALDKPLPQPESQGSPQCDLPRTRSGNHPDAGIRARERGKAKPHPSGSSRSVQLRLDDFQYRSQSQSQGQVAGPSRQTTLSQDITALINPSANPFAPMAPPDTDTDDLDSAAPPDTHYIRPPRTPHYRRYPPNPEPSPNSPLYIPGVTPLPLVPQASPGTSPTVILRSLSHLMPEGHLGQDFDWRIRQANHNGSPSAHDSLINSSAHEDFDILLLQEPYINTLGKVSASSKWRVVYPSSHLSLAEKIRAVILVNASLSTNVWHQVDINDSNDAVAI